MKRIKVYSPKTKVADIIFSKPTLLSVLERLNIKLGFGDSTIAQLCEEYNLSEVLFLDICNIYADPLYNPDVENLTGNDLNILLEYLRTSHKFYKTKYFPIIHNQIHKLLMGQDSSNEKILNKFYDDYDKELHTHFEYEEKILFPYVKSLSKGEKLSSFSISTYEENHDNIEDKLGDLKNIILKYLPSSYSQPLRLQLLENIFMLEEDILCHTRVEDKLLLPLIIKIEKQLK